MITSKEFNGLARGKMRKKMKTEKPRAKIETVRINKKASITGYGPQVTPTPYI